MLTLPSPVRMQDYAFVAFQMSFAVITPALITGAVVGRMKFLSFCIFIFVWSTLVYDPICHWVWGPGGVFCVSFLALHGNGVGLFC